MMLLTQNQTWACQCGEVYQGKEGLKHNSRLGTERVVWKKVRIAGKLQQVQETFECVKCHKPVRA